MTSVPIADDRIKKVLDALNVYAYTVNTDPDPNKARGPAEDLYAELKQFLPSTNGKPLAAAKADAKALLDAVSTQQADNLGLFRHITVDVGPAKAQFQALFDGYDQLPKYDFSARYGDAVPAQRGTKSSNAAFAERSGVQAGKGAGGQNDRVSSQRSTTMNGADQTIKGKAAAAPGAGAAEVDSGEQVTGAANDQVREVHDAEGPDAAGDETVRESEGPRADGVQDPSAAFADALSGLHRLFNIDQAGPWVEYLDKLIVERNGMMGQLRELQADKNPSDETKAQVENIKGTLAQFGPVGNLEKQRAAWQKRMKELDDGTREEFLRIYHGLNGTRANPTVSLEADTKTEEGRKLLGIVNRMAGRPNNDLLTEKETAALDGYLQSKDGERVAGLKQLSDTYGRIFANAAPGTDPHAIHDLLAEMLFGYSTGRGSEPTPALEGKLRRIFGMPDPDTEGGAAATAAGSTNPKSPHFRYKGLTQHQRVLLEGHPNAVSAIESWNQAYDQYQAAATSRFNTMMSLLSSGLPIEGVLLMFMALMTENEEDKLKLKMREVTVAEEFERMNAEIDYKQKKAEQIWGHYADGKIDELKKAEPNVDWDQVDRDRKMQRLNPTDFGFTSKTSAMLMQELQMQTQTYKQTMEALMATMRVFQDMVNRAIQNIR